MDSKFDGLQPKPNGLSQAQLALLRRAAAGELNLEDEAELEDLLVNNAQAASLLQRWSSESQDVLLINQLSQPSWASAPTVKGLIERVQADGPHRLTESANVSQDDLPELNSDDLMLIRKIGQGGMGVVYEAFDKSLGRPVAIKLLAAPLSQNARAKELLVQEAQSVAKLQHENVVTIHSLHLSGPQPYLVEQFVPGGSLADRLKQSGRLTWPELVELSRQLAKGLSAAHNAGVIHRDLKPDNVLLDNETGVARIADFGLALRSELSNIHQSIVGTPAFMSPEQTQGHLLGPSSDLFSLGSVLYTAATGQAPFSGRDATEIMDRIRTWTPTGLQEQRPELPRWWVTAVEKLLQKSLNDRFASAEEFLQAIQIPAPAAQSLGQRWAWYIAAASMLTAAAWAWMFFNREQSSKQLGQSQLQGRLQLSPEEHLVWFEVQGDQERYNSLNAAIDKAAPGSTVILHGVGYADCDPIVIKGKPLTVVANDRSNLVLRPNRSDETTSSFISSDSDLRVVGVKIESSRKAETSLPIHSTFDIKAASLSLQKCTISETSFVTCINLVSGQVELIDCKLLSPKGLGLLAFQTAGTVSVKNCYFDTQSSFAIVSGGPISDLSQPKTSIDVEGSTLAGRSLVRFMVGRPPYSQVSIRLSHLLDLCDNQLFLTGPVKNRPSGQFGLSPLVSLGQRLARWQESHCVHRQSTDFLGTLRPQSTQVAAREITSWEEWTKIWGFEPTTSILADLKLKHAGDSLTVDPDSLPEAFRNCGCQLEPF